MLGENNGISFLYSSLQVVQNDRGLMGADANSVLNAVSAIASMNLMIDPSFGQAFIATYKFKDGFVWKNLAQFQIGYKGLIELGHRSNQFKGLNTDDVRQGEFKSVDRMTGEIEFDWNQDQDERKKLPVIGYVAYFKLTNGFTKSLFMTIKEMKEHAEKWSKNYKDKDNGWQKDFDGMGRKTVLKLLLDKYAPKSTEMKRAIKFDQAIIDDIDGNKLNYIDNPNTTQKIDLDEQNRLVERQRFLDHIASSKTIEVLEQCFEHIDENDQEIKTAYDKKLKELKSKK